MRRACLSVRLSVLVAVILAPAIPAAGQSFECFDFVSELECIFGGCIWCKAYLMCSPYQSAYCDCSYHASESACGSVPGCQWCAGLTLCKNAEESCACGDSTLDPDEECDSSPNCSSLCTCEKNYVSVGGLCVPRCGDGIIVGDEQCEYLHGVPTPHCTGCRCEPGYVPHPTIPALGCGIAPVITSGAATTFVAGQAGSFAMTATGDPTPTLSASGALPTGVSLADGGSGTASLAGTPAAATGGVYPLVLSATNSWATATQAFTLTVHEAPAITSPGAVTFTVGQTGSFTVTTSGFPAPTLELAGTLPGGIGFTDNGDGTATLSGTAELGSGGSYPLTLTAGNGVGTAATAGLTLTVTSVTTFTGATATGTGEATAALAGGGAGCTFATAAFVPTTAVPAATPTSFPHGLFEFTLVGCDGPVSLTIVYPAELPAGTVYWKYGPEPGNTAPHWYQFVAPSTEPSATFTLLLDDGARGDDDLSVNGSIVDQGGPGQPPDPIPALGLVGFALLGLVLALGGIALLRRLR